MFFTTAFAADLGIAAKSKTSFFELFSTFLSSFPYWILAGVIFWMSFYIADIVKKIAVGRIISKAKYEVPQEGIILIGRVISAGIIVLGGVIALKIIGLDLGLLLGSVGLGVGFAFKDLLANFIGGVVILTQKKFKIGDLIKIDDQLGKITEIESRTTQIQAFDGTVLIIPNSKMLTSVVQNLTSNSFRRISFEIGVHYSTSLKKAVETALAAVQKNPNIVPKPAPQVFINRFDDSSIILEVRFWVESVQGQSSWLTTKSEIIQTIKQDFDEASIRIPFPTRTIEVSPESQKPFQSVVKKTLV
jgi:small-conductance mechanosensitive channel